ncbi:MAG: hypothetical protein AABN33_18215 [Acidobacteriota bacterium]
MSTAMPGVIEEVEAWALKQVRMHSESPTVGELIVYFVERKERRRVVMIRCSDGRVLDSRPLDSRFRVQGSEFGVEPGTASGSEGGVYGCSD